MATTDELITLLKERLSEKARLAMIGSFPKELQTDKVKNDSKKFGDDLAEYAEDEIRLIQRIIVETIGIDFTLTTNGNSVYVDDLDMTDTLSENKNDSNNSGKIVGKLDLKIRK